MTTTWYRQEGPWYRPFKDEGSGHLRGKESQPANVLAEGEGNIKYENFFFFLHILVLLLSNLRYINSS